MGPVTMEPEELLDGGVERSYWMVQEMRSPMATGNEPPEGGRGEPFVGERSPTSWIVPVRL
jgi:hypothetical protein